MAPGKASPPHTVRSITLRQVLTMTGGLPAESGFEKSSDWVQSILREGVDQAPSQGFSYSNSGSHLLSAILMRSPAERRSLVPAQLVPAHPATPTNGPRLHVRLSPTNPRRTEPDCQEAPDVRAHPTHLTQHRRRRSTRLAQRLGRRADRDPPVRGPCPAGATRRAASPHRRDALALPGAGQRSLAGRAVGDDAGARPLLGERLRPAPRRGEAERAAAVHDRDRRGEGSLPPRAVAARERDAADHDPRLARLGDRAARLRRPADRPDRARRP